MMAFSGVRSSWRHVRQELRLVLAGLCKLGVRLLELLEQPRVLDGDDRLVGERLQQRDLASVNGRGLRSDDDQEAMAAPHGGGGP